MKLWIASTLVAMTACLTLSTAQAQIQTHLPQDCKLRMTDQNWPNDQLQTVMSCVRTQTVVGDESYGYNSLCFAIIRTEYADFKDRWYKTLRFNQGENGAYSTIVVQNPSGKIKDGYYHQNGNQLTIGSDDHTSGTTGEKWVEETVVDLKNYSSITFNTYKNGWFSQKLTHSTTYQCQRVQ